MFESPWLNMYLYPDEVDYARARPLARDVAQPAGERARDRRAVRAARARCAATSRCVYLSLGSLGSADVELMRTLVAELADAPVPRDRLEGPAARPVRARRPNMAGAEFLPQTSILPQVDLVITHGGNNTVTESLYFGKPMVVLPLFWDQYDNAQRVHDTGFGVRLDTYGHSARAS